MAGEQSNIRAKTWFDVKAGSVEESNLFLRCLWAALRRRLGPLSWAFTPRKDGSRRTVTFGRASIPNYGVIGFGISYVRRGVINQLWSQPEAGTEHILSEIAASVQEANSDFLLLRPAWITVEVEVFPPVNITRYETSHLTLRGLAKGAMRLGLCVSGYDESDCQDEFLAIAEPVLDALSVFTNCSFEYVQSSICQELVEPANARWASADWLDDAPIIDGRLSISSEQLQYLGELAIAVGDGAAVRAARLFHQALHLDYKGVPTLRDAVRTLYLSALEASAPNQVTSNCEKCGQPIHSIRKRVRELTRRHLGEAAEGIIDRAYNARSGYLHTGSTIGKRPFFGHGIRPLLDADAQSGCYLPAGMDNTINVREFTSFILREALRELQLPVTPI
jgi:hypothetical protein